MSVLLGCTVKDCGSDMFLRPGSAYKVLLGRSLCQKRIKPIMYHYVTMSDRRRILQGGFCTFRNGQPHKSLTCVAGPGWAAGLGVTAEEWCNYACTFILTAVFGPNVS